MTHGTNVPTSLTQREAAERAALISVERYDIAVDLRGLYEGPVWASTSTVTFTCTTPGAATFVDCVAEISEATLNGVALDLATAEGGRLPLPDLAARNVLVVTATQADTGHGAGILRTVDTSDKLVYVWTSFECDDARRAWACFDQPDLKAPHAFTVTAPETWTVLSNSGPDGVVDSADGDGRTWSFLDTPPLSTYVVVINAGPFHELRRQVGGHDLGLYSRQSTALFLERDAEELFDLTEKGLAFFGERFALPFPQERYDQVFVPNMGGAMENWGCVTWTDAVLYRSLPTYAQRGQRAMVLLHEMAHMWFGDMVTMRWWDDLWLNEAFASWASTWAATAVSEFNDAWAGFLTTRKLDAYRLDMGPASHPIRGEVADVSAAMATFDAITYAKGESVLKQLAATIGEDAFVEGLRDYFGKHAWSNTRLADLMDAFGRAAGRDLGEWTIDWLDRAGTDTITLVRGDDGDRLEIVAPEGTPRPHTFTIGSYSVDGERLVSSGSLSVSSDGTAISVDLPGADLHLLNDDDLTFAAVRTDAASQQVLFERAGALPTPIARAVALATAQDMVFKGELAVTDYVALGQRVLEAERSPAIVEPALGLLRVAIDQWAPTAQVESLKLALANVLTGLVDVPDLRAQSLNALAASASTDAHFAILDEAAEDNVDLAWRVLARLAELGTYDEAAVEALGDRDPDPESGVRALGVIAARPDPDAKQQVWDAVFRERSVHVGLPLIALATYFWRPGQDDVLAPFAQRYLDEVTDLGAGGLLELGSIMASMFPAAAADDEFLARARELAEDPDLPAFARAKLLMGTDALARQLRARAV
ncbi:aminopeptidase N [Nocardioides sp. InS609-2]|uniref:aminopeptidase N n=1 Tax=Nocardioides sp. InS609-2 TaxID=2760705 RepID=UPI00209B6C84|nr:aminopeptidase N [Nocardioides sp. InS609-2]